MFKDDSILIFLFFIFSVIFAIVFISTFNGCTKVVYKDVYVPIKCDIEMPLKPILSGNLINDFTNALKHSEILEKDLKFCVKGV